ncbi:MAG: AsmA family protein [Pseudomonadota bacterium]
MGRLLAILGSIVVVLIGALLIGPSFFDWNKYKPEISKKIEQATGYQVEMSGDINLAIIPSPTAKIEGLSVSVPGEEPFLKLNRADVQLALAPLLQKKVEVDQVTLIEPVVNIRKNKDGSMSYMTEKLLKAAAVKDAVQGESSSSAVQPDIAFNKVSIEKGQISYVDVAANQTHELKAVDVVLRAQSLKGPFATKGAINYNSQDIAFEGQTEGVLDNSGALPVQMTLSIPQGDTSVQFSGVVDTKALEVQGNTKITSANLQAAGQAAKLSLPASLKEAVSVDGTLVAGQDAIKYSPVMITLGDFKADGDVSIVNFKDKNPVRFDIVLESNDVLALDGFAPKGKSSGVSGEGGAKKAAATSPVPDSLQLPFALQGTARMSLAGVQFDGKLYQGLDAQVKMADKAIQASTKIQKAPGDTNVDAAVNLTYASASRSNSGAILYADPSLSITAKGKVSSVSKLANAYDIQLNDQARTIGSAGFNINANLEKDRIVLNNSSLALDDTNAAIAGFYKPNASGRDTVGIDLSADSINFDKFIPQKAQSTADSAPAGSGAQDSVAAVKKFSLPFDADFDISIQKAQFQGKPISGIRLEGTMDAKSLNLKQAGVQDYLGTAITTKGAIADLPNISGIDMDIFAKTANVRALMENLKMDTASLPANIGAAEANVSAQGDLNTMAFSSNIKALSGQVDAKGNVKNPMNKPQFSNMQLGIKHLNFVKAMQIVNPEFKAGKGLQQKIDIFAKVDQSGDVITLSDITGSFGPMSMGGNIKAVTGGGKPSIDGTIALGTVPLDTFLGDDGAEKARKAKSSGGGSTAASSSNRWSSRPLDVSWINNANVNLSVSAKGVNYGGWAFTAPKTTITMNSEGLKISNLQAGLFGGSATVNTTLKPHNAGGLSAAITSSMTNVGLEPLVYAMSNSNRLKAQGNVSMSMNVNAAGTSANALVNALGGTATLEGRDVLMEGFDLAKLARSLSADIKPGDSVQALTSGLRGGTTQIDTIDGQYNIQSGVANITSMVMEGPAAIITSRGNANIPKWTIDTKHAISLKNAADDVPPFEITIAGPLDNPGNTFGKGILEDYLQRKIQRKLAKEAEKFLGDKVDGELGGVINQILGGGGAQQQQAPAPAPQEQAPAAGNNAQPAQQQQAPEASQEEQLIRGVLDGLLR